MLLFGQVHGIGLAVAELQIFREQMARCGSDTGRAFLVHTAVVGNGAIAVPNGTICREDREIRGLAKLTGRTGRVQGRSAR